MQPGLFNFHFPLIDLLPIYLTDGSGLIMNFESIDQYFLIVPEDMSLINIHMLYVTIIHLILTEMRHLKISKDTQYSRKCDTYDIKTQRTKKLNIIIMKQIYYNTLKSKCQRINEIH